MMENAYMPTTCAEMTNEMLANRMLSTRMCRRDHMSMTITLSEEHCRRRT